MALFSGFLETYDSTINRDITTGDIMGYTPHEDDVIVASACPAGDSGNASGFASFVIQIDPNGIGQNGIGNNADLDVLFSVSNDGIPANLKYYEIKFIYNVSQSYPHTFGFGSSGTHLGNRDGTVSSPYLAYFDHTAIDNNGGFMGVTEVLDSLESIFRNHTVGSASDFTVGNTGDFSSKWTFTRDEVSNPATLTITSNVPGANFNFSNQTAHQWDGTSTTLGVVGETATGQVGNISDNVAPWVEWDSTYSRWIIYVSDTSYTGDIAYHVITPS